jgi:hypothetical protein
VRLPSAAFVWLRLPDSFIRTPFNPNFSISAKPTSWPSPRVGLSRVDLFFLCCSVLSISAFQRFSVSAFQRFSVSAFPFEMTFLLLIPISAF